MRFDAGRIRIAALQQSRLLQRSRERISSVSQLTDVRVAMSHSSRKVERVSDTTTRTDARRALDTARVDVWQVERAALRRALGKPLRILRRLVEDRKSTRLNSSH